MALLNKVKELNLNGKNDVEYSAYDISNIYITNFEKYARTRNNRLVVWKSL